MTAAASTRREQVSPRRGMRVDNPVTGPKHDRLDRMPPARRLVRQAYEALADSETVAIGLDANWGWGKTSFLRLMEEAVEEDPDFFDRDPNRPPPVVIWFKPWWFSGRKDLYTQFFLEIGEQAKRQIELRKEKKRWADALGALAVTVSGGTASPLVDALAKEHERQVKKAGSLNQLRQQATEELKQAKRQLWIFIDDIDRLEPKDAVQFIGLVRSMADLPWVRYFLAYDKKQLRHLIREAVFPHDHNNEKEESQSDNEEPLNHALQANAYLDKFIQIELDLGKLVDQDHKEQGSLQARSTEESIEKKQSSSPSQATENPNFTQQVRGFARNEYTKGEFPLPADRIAWIRTYVEGLSANGESIRTPRDYIRWHNNRCILIQFDPHVLEKDVSAITECLQGNSKLDAILGGDASRLADDIYRELLSSGRQKAARRMAQDFMKAWVGRMRASAPEPEFRRKERDLTQTQLFIKIEKGEVT